MVVLCALRSFSRLGISITKTKHSLICNELAALCVLKHERRFHKRGSSTVVNTAFKVDLSASIVQTVPTSSHSLKVIFDDHHACDFKYVWLRDNCHCPRCIHPDNKQKLTDTATLDINIRPKGFKLNDDGKLEIEWSENEGQHISIFDSNWLHKYGRSFTMDTFDTGHEHVHLPKVEYWNRVQIWKNVPEISYREAMTTDHGLRNWLEMIYKYGVAIMRNVPCQRHEIINVVNRFAYVKTTIWGQTFDVVCEPVQSDPTHLAYTGMYLEHHTDMNYREKSPGLQMLHCLKANDPNEHGVDVGGKSFFVDGFYVANWLRDTHPAAFHILSSTPVKFAIKSHSMNYSQTIPVICVDKDGEVQEIHYNNRTMAPLQVPSHLVMPFYHAYQLLASKMREPSSQLEFHLVPGDLVAFNNRRVLHGRTSFDPTKITRHLQGCYVDIDEVFTRYRAMMSE